MKHARAYRCERQFDQLLMGSYAVQSADNPAMESSSLSSLLDDDARWALALRVAESQHFAKSPLLSRFLLFVCERSLLGFADELTEHNIGVLVFKRRPG